MGQRPHEGLSRRVCRAGLSHLRAEGAAAHQGGTDGDGLPPAFDLATQGEEFMSWITTVKWEAIEKQVRALLAYAKAEGATSFGVVGCCWGGWPCFETSAMTTGLCPASVVRPSPCERRGDGMESDAVIDATYHSPHFPRRR